MDTACLQATELNLELRTEFCLKDRETVSLQPRKHSCTMLCLQLQMTFHFRAKAGKVLCCISSATLSGRSSSCGSYVWCKQVRKASNICSEISILAEEKKNKNTSGNLSYTCQERRRTHSKQKLSYLSYTKKYVMLPHGSNTSDLN